MLNYHKLYLDSPDLSNPQHEGDAGFDLGSYGDVILETGIPTLVNTGISVEVPIGSVGFVLGRSGLAFKQNITVFHIGVIDSGYKGEIKVKLINFGEPFIIHHGDRIAQLVILQLYREVYSTTSSVLVNSREDNGLGSTGL